MNPGTPSAPSLPNPPPRVAGRAIAPASARPAPSLLRPAFLLILVYAVAICFERIVEIEIFKPYRIVGFLLVVAAVLTGRLRTDGIVRAAVLLVSIGAALAGIHVLVTGVPTEGLLLGVSLWIFNIATYVAICSLLRNRKEIVIVLVAHALAMLVASVDILQHSAEMLAAEGASIRVSGDFKNPAHACLSILVATLILITVFRAVIVRREHLLAKVAIFGFGAAIVLFEFYVASLTGSRAGALQFLVGVTVYAALIGWKRVAVGAVLLAALALPFAPRVLDWSALQESNILLQRTEYKGLENDRYYLWRAGLDAYVDSFGVGVGIGQYRLVHQEYFRTYENIGDSRMAEKKLSLHSDYVTALVEFGTVGVVVYLVLWGRIWRACRRALNPDVRAISLALVAAALTIGASHAVTTYFGLWLYLALLALWVRFEQADAALARERPG